MNMSHEAQDGMRNSDKILRKFQVAGCSLAKLLDICSIWDAEGVWTKLSALPQKILMGNDR